MGKVIALLAEEGDDISNLEPPKEKKAASKREASSPSSPPSPHVDPTPTKTSPHPPKSHHTTHIAHSRPLFPSVYRLLLEFNITKPEDIKGTGVRGMLTKGDVLAYLGKASGPSGTYKEPPSQPIELIKKEELKVDYSDT